MTQNQFFCDEEANLYQEIIALLEWKVKKPNNQLYNDFFPVMVSEKALVKLCLETAKLDYKKFITFKPLKNNKHCQFLVELLYEEQQVQDLLTIKQQNKSYGAKIIDYENNILEEISNCDTETEAKFCVIYQYFLTDDIKDKIKPIKDFDEKYKKLDDRPDCKTLKGTKTLTFSNGKHPISKDQREKLDDIEKYLGKKFEGRTSGETYDFLSKWHDSAIAKKAQMVKNKEK